MKQRSCIVPFNTDTCPPAICPPGKTNFTTNPDDYCPVCDLGERKLSRLVLSSQCEVQHLVQRKSYRREPCSSSDHCPMKLGCSQSNNCHYSKGCQANEDCGEHFECDQAQHTCSVKNNYCQSEDMCRAGWTCKENQCVEDDEDDKGVQNSPDKCDCRECEALCNIKT
uniref:TNFR-Cys domain-containing protein n=1 Tax=Romanomermis culicivorax TaxID=13658 RepID=A0A915J5L8_ROMCU